jgi:myosin heavy chain 6/7
MITFTNRRWCTQSTSLANQAEKRQRSFDKIVDEWKRKVADLQGELERSQKESRGNAAEVYKLRAQLEESNETTEAVRRENKNLTGGSFTSQHPKIYGA